MAMISQNPLSSRRVRAPAIHLAVSLLVAALASVIVFVVWYPPPYASIAAGTSLFLLLISVDVVLGPALTAVAADPVKPPSTFRRDLMVIAAVQLAGLGYGLYSIAQARPVYLVFEVDRFRVVTAADVDESMLPEAPVALRELPRSGPKVIAAAKPTQPDEVLKSLDLAIAGFDISVIPRNWRDYATQRDVAVRVSRSATELKTKYPASADQLARIASDKGQPVESLRFLPVQSRSSNWVALISSADAQIVGFLPVDGFF